MMSVRRVRNGARRAHRIVNAILLVGIVAQFYLAGLAIFGRSFAPHAVLGWSLIPLTLISTAIAGVGFGRDRRTTLSLLQTVAVAMQPVFIFVLSGVAIELAAVHTVSALFAFGLGIYLEQLARGPGHRAPARRCFPQ
jgi:hypothetical protein